MNEKKRLKIRHSDLEAIHRLHDRLGLKMFRQTFNDFFIMEGICPDVPIGMHAGIIPINDIYQPGVIYTQYEPWEDHIDKIWGPIRTYNFGNIPGCKN